MSLSLATPVFENNASGQNDNTSISVTAADGTYIYWFNYRRSKTITTAAPIFNGQTFAKILATSADTGEALVDIYRLLVPATKGGTFNVTSLFSAYAWYNTSVVVVTATATVNETVITPQIYNSGTYSAPSISLGTVASGNLVLSFLAAMDWDTGYSTVGATWSSVAPATNRGSITNTGTPGINKLNVQSLVGTGAALTAAWTASAPNSMYTHIAINLTEAAVTTVTLTTPVTVGGTGYSATTVGMGTITSLTNAAITGTSTNAFNYNMNAWVNGVAYLAIGAGRTQTAGDGALTANGTITLNPPTGYITVTIAGIDRGAWSIGKDTNIVDGDQVSLPTAAGTLNADGTLTDYIYGTYTMWRRDNSDGKMYSSTLTVSTGGVTAVTKKQFNIGIGIGL